jgi:2-dehydro-3-deoxygluconokinase
MPAAELVSFGEAMVRLSPPGHELLETTPSVNLTVAGAELNAAVAVASLGHSAAWLSRVPANPLGRLVEARARAAGVDTSLVERCEGERQALFFVELGAPPRPARVTYDRQSSAFARLDPERIDWQGALAGVRCFHTSTITMVLSEACHEAARRGLETARSLGCRTSLDLNFRSMLSSAGELAESVRRLAPHVDTLICSANDAAEVFGAVGDPADVAAELVRELGITAVAVSARVERERGMQGRVSAMVDGEQRHSSESPPFVTVDPLGGGDAFAAGVIHGTLVGDAGRGLEIGDAMAALKQTVPGDFALFSVDEVEAARTGTMATRR